MVKNRYDNLLESVNRQDRFAIPIDLSKVNKNQIMCCANTHLFNLAMNIAGVTAINALLVHTILRSLKGLASTIKWGLGIGALLSVPPALEQIFARDFVIFNKDDVKRKIKSKQPITLQTAVESEAIANFPILAVDNGVIVVSDRLPAYGNVVMIKHSDKYYSCYGHMPTGGRLVKQGDKVTKGQKIGLVGDTGNSSGPHLHFEMTYTDPTKILGIGKPLENFENHRIIDLSFMDITTQGFNPDHILNPEKYWTLNTSGEIPSWCFMTTTS